MSPTELQIKDGNTCHSCGTFDCIKGQRAPAEPARIVQRGCELGLFLPGKVGNLDCTLCLDCVHACPHDNIALTTRVPAIELLDTRRRSGIGKLEARFDLAALAVVEQLDFGDSYALTLKEWRRRFLESWADIAPLGFDEPFRRLWEFYLCYCEAGFRARTIDVNLIALQGR